MNFNSISARIVQLRRLPPSLWYSFAGGWLSRNKNQWVPCLLPECLQLLRVPLREFYESYAFFCENPLGLNELGYFQRQLKPGDVFYDIGGFRGAYSAAAKMKLGASSSVHIFEPLPKNIEAIRRVASLNRFSEFTVNSLAVGDGVPVAGGVNEQDGMLRIGDVAAADLTNFPSISLDEYIANGNPPPSIVKIDVDGFELHVLRGAQGCLARHPRLWLEVHPTYLKAQGKSADAVLQFLRDNEYRISFFCDFNSPSAETSYHIWCE